MNQFSPDQSQPVQQVPPNAPPPQQQGGAPSPFEMPPSQNQGGQNAGFQPTPSEPAHNSSKTWILIIILLVILILGGVVFSAWEGWISLGPLDKYLGKSTTTTTTPEVTAVTNNDATRKSDLTKIKDALKKYYQANQKYPISLTVDKTSSPNSVLRVLVPADITALPSDPVSTNYYGYKSDGTTFELTAVLDDTTDTSGTKVGNYYLYKITDSSVETPASTSSTTPSTTTP